MSGKLKKALTFSVSGALLATTALTGCEKPIRTANPGPEPEERVNEGPVAEPEEKADAGAEPEGATPPTLPEIKPTVNPGPEPVPDPE